MQQNQNYFALADAAGRLTHRFLLVSNLEPRDPSAIVQGNERVLRARLADARFFYDQDRKAAARGARRSPAQHRLPQQARHAGGPHRAPAFAGGEDRAEDRGRRRRRRPRGAARQGRSRHRHGRRVPGAAGRHGPLLRAARRRARRRSPTRSRSTTGRASPATRCPRAASRRRSRSPTSSRRSPACSASARCRPATRIRSGCAAPRSA